MELPDRTVYHSRLSTYGTYDVESPDIETRAGCPRLFKAKYVDRSFVEPSSPYAAFGSVVHDALFLAEEESLPLLPDALDAAWSRQEGDLVLGPEWYNEAQTDLERYLERPSDMLATVAVEQHLTMPLCEIDGQQYYAAGYIDKISVDPDDPATLVVDDYKTNRAPVSQADVDASSQLTLYGCLARANAHRYLPDVDPEEVTIWVAWDGIKHHRLSSPRAHWQMDQYEDWLRVVVRKIVRDETAEPILNDECDWCPIRFDCPVFSALPGEGERLADRMSTTTDLESRVRLMRQAQLVVKTLTKGLIDPVRSELLDRAHDGDVVVDGTVYYEDYPWETVIDVAEVFSILGENEFLSLAGVTQKSLDAIGKTDPILRDKLRGTMTRQPKGRAALKQRKAD